MMTLTAFESLIIIAMVMLGTLITRFLPFILFPDNKETHPFVQYLGRVLPYASIGLLVIYCLKEVNITQTPFGLPEALSIGLIVILHYWKSNVLLSVGAGTLSYMLLVQRIFS